MLPPPAASFIQQHVCHALTCKDPYDSITCEAYMPMLRSLLRSCCVWTVRTPFAWKKQGKILPPNVVRPSTQQSLEKTQVKCQMRVHALVLESTVHSELKAYSPLLSNIFRKRYLITKIYIKENRNQKKTMLKMKTTQTKSNKVFTSAASTNFTSLSLLLDRTLVRRRERERERAEGQLVKRMSPSGTPR